MNENWLDEIEQYLGGEMTPDEESLFESKLKTNEELAGIFAIYQAFGSYHEDAPSTPLTEEDRKEEEQLKNTLKGLSGLQAPPEELLAVPGKSLRSTTAEEAASLEPGTSFGHFRWRKYVVAAGIIGIIATTLFVVVDRNKRLRDAASLAESYRKHEADSIAQSNLLLGRLNELLSETNVRSHDTLIPVLKNSVLSFAEKQDSITIKLSNPAILISEINRTLRHDSIAISKFDSKYILLKEKSDSLNNLMGKYRFSTDSLVVYLNTRQIQVVKLSSGYYILADNIVYECKKSNVLLALKKIADNSIVDEVVQISLIHSK